MRTTDEIYASLTERFAALSGMVVAEGGDMSLRLRAVAAELLSLEAQAEFTARQCLPQTAQGEYLDHHAALRGLTRKSASKAVGSLRFSVNSPAVTALSIPVGTECRTAAGTAFLTTEAGSIPVGSYYCTVAAEAVQPGYSGNAAAHTVTYMPLPPTGVNAVDNADSFAGGGDAEGDEALRARVTNSYRSLPNGANTAYYEDQVLRYPGAAAVVVTPRNRGAGTVDICFTVADGIPNAAQIAEVRALLEAQREICVDIAVAAPVTATVNVAAALTIAEGYSAASVCAAAEAAVAAFFHGRLLGKPVYRARLEALLMGIAGVENCSLSAPAADLAAASGTLPVAGTITISEAE